MPQKPPPAFYDDLTLTEADAWRRLMEGAADRHSPYHLMQVATLGLAADGQPNPRLRTVVLRAVDGPGRVLRFHTDARSPKIAEITHCPRVQALLYDPGQKVQLRLDADAVLAPEPVRAAAWAATGRQGRHCYAVAYPPSRPQDGPAAPFAEEADPSVFCPVLLTVRALDWLFLAAEGHRRARFTYDPAGHLATAQWLTP